MSARIALFLWFDGQAEEAARYYCSIFKHSRLGHIARYGPDGPGAPGSVMTVEFELDGQSFTALNGGPQFKFTEAVSFVIRCDGQQEVDHYWDRLTADGGAPVQCGWLRDKYGLSWQVVPKALPELLTGSDPATARRVMQATMRMVKLDIGALQQAARGTG